MNTAKEKNRRRVYLINPPVQMDMLKYLILLIVIICISQLMATSMFFSQVSEIAAIKDNTLDIFDLLSQLKVTFMIYQLIPVLTISCVGGLFLHRFTNRIVGPIYNIHRIVKKINEGQREELDVKLRKDDYFQELAIEVNTLIQNTHKAK